MKKILTVLLFLVLSSTLTAQISILISGYVTDSSNGYSIANHAVTIQTDSVNGSNFPYYAQVYTNANGYYANTLLLPAGTTQWQCLIKTYDCVFNLHTAYGTYGGGTTLIQADFDICTSLGTGNPYVSTGGATAITHTTATLHGMVDPGGSETYVTFEYGTIPNSGGFISCGYFYGDSLQPVTQTISNLQPGTLYYYKIHGSNAHGSMTGFDSTFTTLGATGCHAAFTAVSDSINTQNTFTFLDQSTGTNFQWYWNFGDPASGGANTSTSQNPVHTFSAAGTYIVCLTITSDSCTSTYCTEVVVHDSTNYHQIYGQIFAGNFPVISCTVTIFSADTGQNSNPYVATCNADSMGIYYFTMVPTGNYYISAIPNLPAGYLPTYYGNSLNWQGATIISLGQANNPYNINLIAANNLMPGNGNIHGQVGLGDQYSNVIEHVTMLLLNADGNAIAFNKLDALGDFQFPQLDFGTYYLRAEIPGVTSDLVAVVISAEKPTAVIQMTFSGTRILGIDTPTSNADAGNIYPNPVVDVAAINLDSKASDEITIVLTTTTGQIIYQEQATLPKGKSVWRVGLGSIPAGIYTLRILSRDGVNITRKLIKSQ